ncbi:MAG: acetyl-CoA carboxylase biotin carboxyl carrier protein [Gammaproteobacteria bacterium]|nr:MAG: acetyl-CoA carboxylase biotin carboxyl carrier protein [Gammaproteobacteria bacterium]
MDIRKVKKLIELLKESGISEIEVHEGEESVRISSYHATSVRQAAVQAPSQAPVNIPQASVAPELVQDPAPVVYEGHIVKSPMVGIYYSSPSPDTSPFVEIGQKVNKGDVLCIVEAMKIMNQIESETSGVISKIFVENGEPIEYGQALFALK